MKTNRRKFIMRTSAFSLTIPLLSFPKLLQGFNFESSDNNTGSGDFIYESDFYKIKLNRIYPFVQFLSVDSLGKRILHVNPIIKVFTEELDYNMRIISKTKVEFYNKNEASNPEWVFEFNPEKFIIKSMNNGADSSKMLTLKFNKKINHVTLLALMKGRNQSLLPGLIHMPDMGSLQLESSIKDMVVIYDASRKGDNYTIEEDSIAESAGKEIPKSFISIALPSATKEQGSVDYKFTVACIYAPYAGVEQPKYDGYRRNYLNIFQINPQLQMFANNTCSDPCAFTLYASSMMALKTPTLVGNLTALDLLKMSVEQYLSGTLSYGLVGYYKGYKGIENSGWDSPYNSLDAYPSLVIAACNYVKGSKNLKWAEANYAKIQKWMDDQLKRDYDNDGLVEYELSGNTGSWKRQEEGNEFVRPANWWDAIGFAHKDAFSNIYTYDAIRLFAEVSRMLNKKVDETKYNQIAESLKSVFFKTFFNPKTGLIAGWKSKDGQLHDYYFTFLNSMAIYYNLVPVNKCRDIMQKLWDKMKEVGYADFSNGLPGNLIPVIRQDFATDLQRWGGSKKEDGTDGFQHYENGGTSINHVYYTVKALQKVGLREQAEMLSTGLLKGFAKGNFQGYSSKKDSRGWGVLTKDWKTWDGENGGYEGFLCDGYLTLLAFNQDNK